VTKTADPQADIMRLAWSWAAGLELHMPGAPKSPNGSTAKYQQFTYDQTQRAYIVPRKDSGPSPVEFKLVSIYDDCYLHGSMRLVTPTIVVPNRNRDGMSLTVENQRQHT